jgi:hypothetical protein
LGGGTGEGFHVTPNVTNYQGLPPLISPNTKQETSPLPQLMKKPPVDKLDMCAESTSDKTHAHAHTRARYSPQCCCLFAARVIVSGLGRTI